MEDAARSADSTATELSMLTEDITGCFHSAVDANGRCVSEKRIKNLKVVERVCTGQVCFELERLEQCITSSIYSIKYPLSKVNLSS
ncbi:hypothetical protein COP1_046028 [Malus domestica]